MLCISTLIRLVGMTQPETEPFRAIQPEPHDSTAFLRTGAIFATRVPLLHR